MFSSSWLTSSSILFLGFVTQCLLQAPSSLSSSSSSFCINSPLIPLPSTLLNLSLSLTHTLSLSLSVSMTSQSLCASLSLSQTHTHTHTRTLNDYRKYLGAVLTGHTAD